MKLMLLVKDNLLSGKDPDEDIKSQTGYVSYAQDHT